MFIDIKKGGMSKILVEDEESIRVLQKIIAKEFPKYQIRSAQDGLAAVDLLEAPNIYGAM